MVFVLFMESGVRIYLPFICCILESLVLRRQRFISAFVTVQVAAHRVLEHRNELLPLKDRPQLACFVVETEKSTMTPETALEQPRV